MKTIVLAGALALMTATALPARAETVATVGKASISLEQLEQHVKPKLAGLERQRYEILSDGLNEMIADELLAMEAKSRGISVEALEKKEIEDKAGTPTDEEIQALYDANKERVGGQTLEQIKPRLVEFLTQHRVEARRQAFIDELKKKYTTKIDLQPPVVQVALGETPTRGGGPNAPVTIVEFSDYQCPFCKRAEGSVDQVMKTYGDKVRLSYRDFPLSFHQHARAAANAARCANAQGKFWVYHDKLMAAQDLGTEKYQSLADEVGLDRKKFDECLEKKKYDKEIAADMAAGAEAGVSGTPSFFINGRMIDGAQPFEKFKEIIDDELARAK